MIILSYTYRYDNCAGHHHASGRASRSGATCGGQRWGAVLCGGLGCARRVGARQLVDAWLAEHQATHGAFDEDELRALAEDAGVPYVAAGRSRSAA